MKPMVLALAVTLCGSLAGFAHAQRGGGGGGCQRGGGSMGTPTSVSAFLPLTMNMPRDTSSASMASPHAQQAFAQQMQQAMQSQRIQQAQQDARAKKEETKQRKIAALQKRRDEEKARRDAAKAKNVEKKLAATK